jgi:hypothetical protein
MKRMARSLIYAALMVLVAASLAVAAGSVTQKLECTKSGTLCEFTWAWTADASNASIPTSSMDNKYLETLKGYYIYIIRTNPGATAPTTLYDITLPDTSGVDLAGGMLANRSATATERVIPKIDTVNDIYGGSTIWTAPVLTITNNAVNSATGEVTLICTKE